MFVMSVIYYSIVLIPIYFLIKLLLKQSIDKKKYFNNKIAVITGSGSGLGRALCFELAKYNCNLVCLDVNEQDNVATVEKLKNLNPKIKILNFKLDVTNKNHIKEIADKIHGEFKNGIDILVNNAGVAFAAPILDITDEHIEKIININLVSHFWTIRSFLPKMKEKNSGVIVGISSIVGLHGFSYLVPYTATKFGVTGLMDALRVELAAEKSNVKTLCVHPGFVNTNILTTKFKGKQGWNIIDGQIYHATSPENVANAISEALSNDEKQLIYPSLYKYGLQLLRLLPYCISNHLHKTAFRTKNALEPLPPLK